MLLIWLMLVLGCQGGSGVDSGPEPPVTMPGLVVTTSGAGSTPTVATGGSGTLPTTGRAWSQVAVTDWTSCGVRVTGEVECWGEMATGSPLPGPFTRVALKTDGICGLKVDGTITCWSCEYSGDCEGPDGVFSDLDGNNTRFCAIDDAGAVCWVNAYGNTDKLLYPGGPHGSVHQGQAAECGLPAGGGAPECWTVWDNQSAPPPGLDLVAMDPGSQHVCGIQRDGALRCWGTGATNLPFETPPSGNDWIDITSSSAYSCGLRSGGAVECFGIGGTAAQDLQAGVPVADFVQIEMAPFSMCGLTSAGEILCWGPSNAKGQQDVPP